MPHTPAAVPSVSAMPMAVAALFERQPIERAIPIARSWAAAWEQCGETALADTIIDCMHAERVRIQYAHM